MLYRNQVRLIGFYLLLVICSCVAIPADWEKAYLNADLLFSDVDYYELENITSNNVLPYLGNGYVATVVYSTEMFVSGIFNGNGSLTPSHRAAIPSPAAVVVPMGARRVVAGEIVSTKLVGLSLNVRRGSFHRRVEVGGCEIEQRMYAHRADPFVIVNEFFIHNSTFKDSGCVVPLENITKSLESPDFDISLHHLNMSGYSEDVLAFSAVTKLKEHSTQEEYSQVSVVADLIPTQITLNQGEVRTFVTAIRTSLDSDSPLDCARTAFLEARAKITKLYGNHIDAWENLWQSGISVDAKQRLELAQAINSSLYYILSSARDGFAYSLSPGSLGTNGYNGHTFWDAETWMMPSLSLFYPSIAKNCFLYRYNRLDGARSKAKAANYQGTMFPWESAFTGFEVDPWPPSADYEIHLTPDIALAIQQYWRISRDKEWLRNVAYPILEGIAEFLVSRVEYDGSMNKYIVKGVVGPDEYATGPTGKGVDNNAYTNVAFSVALSAAYAAASTLGYRPNSDWLRISQRMYVPINGSLRFHPEYDGYVLGDVVKQADTILLGYPLLYEMDAETRTNDLEVYEQYTDPNGPAMTWGMFALNWIELDGFKNQEKAAALFNSSYQLNTNGPFLTWFETPSGGCPHFITGAGGFLQGLWAGYGGIRIREQDILFRPYLPESSSFVNLRGLKFCGSTLDVLFKNNSIEFTLIDRKASFNLFKVYVQGTPIQLGYPLLVPMEGSSGQERTLRMTCSANYSQRPIWIFVLSAAVIIFIIIIFTCLIVVVIIGFRILKQKRGKKTFLTDDGVPLIQ